MEIKKDFQMLALKELEKQKEKLEKQKRLNWTFWRIEIG